MLEEERQAKMEGSMIRIKNAQREISVHEQKVEKFKEDIKKLNDMNNAIYGIGDYINNQVLPALEFGQDFFNSGYKGYEEGWTKIINRKYDGAIEKLGSVKSDFKNLTEKAKEKKAEIEKDKKHSETIIEDLRAFITKEFNRYYELQRKVGY